MYVEIGTKAAQLFFWEYLCQIFCIVPFAVYLVQQRQAVMLHNKNNLQKTTIVLFSKVGKAEFLGRTVARPHVYLAEEVCLNHGRRNFKDNNP